MSRIIYLPNNCNTDQDLYAFHALFSPASSIADLEEEPVQDNSFLEIGDLWSTTALNPSTNLSSDLHFDLIGDQRADNGSLEISGATTSRPTDLLAISLNQASQYVNATVYFYLKRPNGTYAETCPEHKNHNF